MQQDSQQAGTSSRRDFVKTTAAAAVATAATLAIPKGVYAAGSDIIKVGLVGCGGRGSGAAQNALHADPGVRIISMGDMFQDKLDAAVNVFQAADEDISKRFDVPKDRQHVGWDAYKGVIADSDMVILATPPHFRPIHLKAVLEANKHCFCEKPVATDSTHLREMWETAKQFGKNGKSLVSGLCYRYDAPKVEIMKRIHAGAIGELRNIEVNYITGGLWHNARQPGWSDMEWQLRNWLYFTWLSGDMIVEQHIHSLDKMMWVKNDEPPAFCYSTGGRTVRTARPQYGNVFDHFCTTYVWADGTKGFAHARQWTGEKHTIFGEVSDFAYGSDGVADIQRAIIKGKNPWKGVVPKHSSVMYDAEHVALMKSIRDGKPINNGDYMCKSTLVAIMGRMSAYTGEKVTWEQALNSKENLAPSKYAFGPIPLPDVAVPGITELA